MWPYKSMLLAAFVTVNAIPAHAGKYICSFSKSGIEFRPRCQMESTGMQICRKVFAPTLESSCTASVFPAEPRDQLACYFFNPQKFTEDALKSGTQSPREDLLKILAQQPGFIVGGVTNTSTDGNFVNVGYLEATGAEFLDVTCIRQP
ncbi:hypothetical protein ABIB00_005447 [Bradyrhizobium sp. LB14.3]|uniref:hypothetical protein n=1 Tax=Bradyrhizobium sp. LB14.3 TaxID=3156328 RepID=UPI003392880D